MNESENIELGELIIAITKGDKDAIGEIFKRCGKAMKAVAKAYLRSDADAEDVVQDCLITIVTKANKFRENKNAKSWINTIVMNAAKNKIGYYKRRGESDLEVARGIGAELDENGLIVSEIFSQLTAKEKSLVIYKYWYKCTVAEMAAIMRRSKSTIQYQLNKLEEKLKIFYKK